MFLCPEMIYAMEGGVRHTGRAQHDPVRTCGPLGLLCTIMSVNLRTFCIEHWYRNGPYVSGQSGGRLIAPTFFIHCFGCKERSVNQRSWVSVAFVVVVMVVLPGYTGRESRFDIVFGALLLFAAHDGNFQGGKNIGV